MVTLKGRRRGRHAMIDAVQRTPFLRVPILSTCPARASRRRARRRRHTGSALRWGTTTGHSPRSWWKPYRHCYPHMRRYTFNRYYDPTTAQFLSVDPLVGQTHAPYALTGDNPLNATEPTGLHLLGCG
ncbi:MAG: hypothetical protein KGL63_06030 [Betaproteobacteria bacterium]|nr:hypothetical protein [Betaproteobacteria bacterium]